MKTDLIKKIEPTTGVNNYLNRPVEYSDKNEHHGSNKGFQSMLDDSIEEIKKEDESFDDAVSKIELTPRDIQLMELRRSKMNLEQTKEKEIEDKPHMGL